jgi:hypothetical protein
MKILFAAERDRRRTAEPVIAGNDDERECPQWPKAA